MAAEIAEAVTTWEKYDWKDGDLWESFQGGFGGYTEASIISSSLSDGPRPDMPSQSRSNGQLGCKGGYRG